MTARFFYEPSYRRERDPETVAMYLVIDRFLRGGEIGLNEKARFGYSLASLAARDEDDPRTPVVSLRLYGTAVAISREGPPVVDVFGDPAPGRVCPRMAIFRCLGFGSAPAYTGYDIWRSPPLLLTAWRVWRSRQ